MKKVPEQYELTENEIKEAIAQWLNREIDDDGEYDFTVSLNVETTDRSYSTYDRPSPVAVITATAVKID